MAIQQIKRNSISDQVFQQLERQMLSGEWKPGDKLPSENDLAADFGVSRMTVRQAIQKLTALGLLETRLGEGTFVRSYTPGIVMNNIIPAFYLGENSLMEVLEFRRMVEIPTAELATQKVTEEGLQKLETIFNEMVAVQKDNKDFFMADLKFHLELANITQNSFIITTYSILHEVLTVTMERIIDVRGATQGIYYHKLILDAMKIRNVELVKKLMTEHIEDTVAAMSDVVKNQD